jgi:hypothetical protein
MSSVFCLATDDTHAVRILNRLKQGGFQGDNVSVLHSDGRSKPKLSTENSTKAPEGAAAGAGTGALLGGTVGWLAGIGMLAIPGLGPLIAAGPILAALSGLAVGGTVGGLTGGLIGMGIPEYEAKEYETRLREGKVLIAVHTNDQNDEAARVRTMMSEEKAEAISTSATAASAKR